MMTEHTTLLVEQDESILTVTMNRPHVRNAQNHVMLEELDRAFRAGVADPNVRVIILAGAGKDFSSGHDLGSPEEREDAASRAPLTWEERYQLCRRLYLDLTLSWRDLSKPLIAQVQGNCIMGGLMVALACDFIIASDDAVFASRSVRYGGSSEQYFALPWAIGVPQTKQYLFTGENIPAATALRLGLVNEVVPRADLNRRTHAIASQIALQDPFAISMAKRACNAALDAQGQRQHLELAFELWAASALRPSVLERWDAERSLSVEEQLRRRDQKFDEPDCHDER